MPHSPHHRRPLSCWVPAAFGCVRSSHGSEESKEFSHPVLLLDPLTSGRSPASAQTLTDTRSLKSGRAAVPSLGRICLLHSILQTG